MSKICAADGCTADQVPGKYGFASGYCAEHLEKVERARKRRRAKRLRPTNEAALRDDQWRLVSPGGIGIGIVIGGSGEN